MRKGSNTPHMPPFTKTTRSGGDKGALYSGMPGYVNATSSPASGRKTLMGTSSIGPHREGFIGKHGKGSTHHKVYGGAADSGTMVKDYKKESTGRPGGVYNTMEAPHKRPAQPGAPIGGGHAGRMEHMVGRARTSAEGRKKSRMY